MVLHFIVGFLNFDLDNSVARANSFLDVRSSF